MSPDRRRHARKRVDLTGECQPEGGAPVAVHISDMSLGGAYLDMESPLPVGTRVKLRIDFEQQGAHADVEAVVRWSTPDGVGVQFGLLGARDTYAITEFLARRTLLPDLRPGH